jgi:hypothetical protein
MSAIKISSIEPYLVLQPHVLWRVNTKLMPNPGYGKEYTGWRSSESVEVGMG